MTRADCERQIHAVRVLNALLSEALAECDREIQRLIHQQAQALAERDDARRMLQAEAEIDDDGR